LKPENSDLPIFEVLKKARDIEEHTAVEESVLRHYIDLSHVI